MLRLHRNKYFLFLFLFLFSQTILASKVTASENIDSLKTVLNEVLLDKVHLDNQKRKSIGLLQKQLSLNFKSQELRYQLYLELFNAYKSFIHDSAYVYCKKASECAYLLKDNNKINYSKVNLGFVLVSSGMFKEGLDTLKTVRSNYLNEQQKFEFYFLMARSNFDLSDYNKIDFYRKLYTQRGLSFCDTIINRYSKNSYHHLSGLGLKMLRSKNFRAAIIPYEKLLKLNLSYRDSAIIYSCLSYLYFSVNKNEIGLSYLLKSSIIDKKYSIKESLALVHLAKHLYLNGNTKEAFVYIHSAIEDNDLYGAKQRKVEISNILPIIEKDKINDIEKQKLSLLIYASTITLLILLTLYFAFANLKQLKKIRIADQLIVNQMVDLNNANSSLLRINKSLDVANQSLMLTNNKLDEVNMIKEEYIGHFFNVNADYIEKMDRLKRSLEKIVDLKQYDELEVILHRLNTNFERECFYKHFDEVFLNLFPNFIEEFNTLFNEKHQTHLIPGQLLNNELRIFALIRLGIDENETIAKILNYSVNTIYTYKTKVKNRSLIPNDDFKDKIMSISTVRKHLPFVVV
ncbi:DUF6377 domain-containing protein [Pedobacter mucosus]|uniref:DUF6377 domain-containing protein n=1 Tax=Pedobacter mucosus TaxID=2895286 RepID=UPI001EE3A594|nr:DUF6377 domain-containing protein [Pedobacter mucosus]UKT62143.1 DUF6377 domain-containing protein [Pedobacter mucosus]